MFVIGRCTVSESLRSACEVTSVRDTLFLYSLNLLAVTSEFSVVAVVVSDM